MRENKSHFYLTLSELGLTIFSTQLGLNTVAKCIVMVRYTLSENSWIDIYPNKYDEESYLRFVRKQSKNVTLDLQQWFNMSSNGWKALVILIPEVEASLRLSRVDGDVTMNLNERERLCISFWLNKNGGMFYVNFYEVDKNGELVKDRGVTLDEKEYDNLMKNASQISMDLSSLVQK
jgi:hypothetical protein